MKSYLTKIISTIGINESLGKIPILNLLIKGGWIMLPIIFLSLIAIYIIIYKLIEFANTTKYSDQWLKNLKNALIEGDRDKAKQLCKQRKSASLSKVIIRVLKRSTIDKNIKNIEGMVESIGKDEIYKLENKVSTLGVISGSAPMMGFLGTVTGLIQSFVKISQSKSQINPAIISGGIYEAMLTTAAGLAVGIIAYLGYNYMIMRITKVTHELEYRLSDIMDPIKECIKKNK
ncbi:MAG: MotA/TolQ/ExbB proton channel family protein [Bacteroidetes bacterium]|nr:MotA/TolQ/ExbB proton channel family protein [Bacteroidota bacterium]